MEITEKLCYGVKENTPKELLYVKRIILRSYDDENRNKEVESDEIEIKEN